MNSPYEPDEPTRPAPKAPPAYSPTEAVPPPQPVPPAQDQPWSPLDDPHQWTPPPPPPQHDPYRHPPAGYSQARDDQGGTAGRKHGLVAGGALIGAAAVYLLSAAFVHAPPFSSGTPGPVASGATHSASHATGNPVASSHGVSPSSPSPTATGTHLPAGVASIEQYLPADVSAVNDCQPTSGIQWKNPGLVRSFDCTDPGLADPNGGKNGFVEAFQMNSYQNLTSSWQNFNNWFGFAKTQGSCPLSSPSGEGLTGWDGPSHPARSDQVLECADSGTTSNLGGNQEIYAWTYPAQNAYMIAVAPSSWTSSQLGTWWKQQSQ